MSEPVEPEHEDELAVYEAELTPTVNEADDRAYAAHQLRLRGTPWKEVADRVGYGSPSSAATAVSNYLARAVASMSATRQMEALQTAVDRYEAVLNEWWDQGTTGHDKDAAGIVLRTLGQLDRILRLGESEVTVNLSTVVISPNPDEYVRQLQQVVADRKKS